MMFATGKFSQQVTYWAPLANDDGFGKIQLAGPVVVKARWEDKQELVVNHQGTEITSRAVIYTPKGIAFQIAGYLYLGVSTNVDPRAVAGAFEIQNVGEVPDLRNLQSLRTTIV